jgi:putative membrane protein
MAATPSDPGPEPAPPAPDPPHQAPAPPTPAARDERRLHPFSWLFVLLTQLRPLILPLLILLVFGRGEWWEVAGVIGAIVLALYSLVYSFGFRYRLGADELLVREGIFNRTERHIPYARVQNIVQKRNPLHRLFGVTELRLESAGGTRPEAVMNVITRAEAARLDRILRGHGAGHDGDHEAEAAEAEHPPLLALPARELFRLGLVTSRGWVVVGALFALYWQLSPSERRWWAPLEDAFEAASGTWSHALSGSLATFVSVVTGVLGFLAVLKLLSIAMAFLTFHGYRLTLHDERVSTDGGLLTRSAASARRDKIQRLLIGESWLARRLDRRWVSCEVAAGIAMSNEDETVRLRWLAPIASPPQVRTIIAAVAPGLDLESLEWRPLHPRAWWRVLKPLLLLWSLPVPGLIAIFGPGASLVWFAAVGMCVLHARGWARFAAYACNGEVIAYRAGWLQRQWTVARIAKGQTVRLLISPFDRRAHMAGVAVDTAGAGVAAFALSIPYLTEDEARALAATLRTRLAAELESDATPGVPAPSPAG